MWYPPASGIRERIEAIHKRHPDGCVLKYTLSKSCNDGKEAMDVARLATKRHIILQRAKGKLRNILRVKNVKKKVKKAKIKLRVAVKMGIKEMSDECTGVCIPMLDPIRLD